MFIFDDGQFSLRGLFALVTGVAVCFGLIGACLNQPRKHQDIYSNSQIQAALKPQMKIVDVDEILGRPVHVVKNQCKTQYLYPTQEGFSVTVDFNHCGQIETANFPWGQERL